MELTGRVALVTGGATGIGAATVRALARAGARYVEGMTASGTPEEVRERVQRYWDAGVQVAMLRPAAAHQTERVLDMFATR